MSKDLKVEAPEDFIESLKKQLDKSNINYDYFEPKTKKLVEGKFAIKVAYLSYVFLRLFWDMYKYNKSKNASLLMEEERLNLSNINSFKELINTIEKLSGEEITEEDFEE